MTDRPDAPQSTLIVGLPVIGPTNPDALPLRVSNALLGGSFTRASQRTFANRKAIRIRHTAKFQGAITMRTGHRCRCNDEVTGPSLKEIFTEIDRLAKGSTSAAELKGIQSYLSGVFVIQNSSRSALIGQLQNVDFQGLAPII